jgi:hypothetical protein
VLPSRLFVGISFLFAMDFFICSKNKINSIIEPAVLKIIFLGRSVQSSKICVDGDFNPREHIIYMAEKNSKYHSFRNT